MFVFQVKECDRSDKKTYAIRSKFLVRGFSLQRPPSQSLCAVFHSHKAESCKYQWIARSPLEALGWRLVCARVFGDLGFQELARGLPRWALRGFQGCNVAVLT